jgi:hypothetical protein
VRDFICRQTGLTHLSFRQMGRGKPAIFDGDGVQAAVSTTEWVLNLEARITVVSDGWFVAHCSPISD